MEKRDRNYPVNMFRICIDNDEGDVSGRAYSPVSKGEMVFEGIGELLLEVDKLFDNIGYPQAFQNRRSFQEVYNPGNAYRGIPECVHDIDSILAQRGESYTYDIVVETRRNASWQGYVFDVHGTERGKYSGEVTLSRSLGLTNVHYL